MNEIDKLDRLETIFKGGSQIQQAYIDLWDAYGAACFPLIDGYLAARYNEEEAGQRESWGMKEVPNEPPEAGEDSTPGT